jgi:hypothetical protein
MTVLFDAGAFVAIERGDPIVAARIERERRAGRAPVTHGAVVAQVWRGGTGRQTLLARMLPYIDVVAVDDQLGRRAGLLLRDAGTSDAIDSALVCLARDGDEVFTSDAEDLRHLAEAADVHIDIVPV